MKRTITNLCHKVALLLPAMISGGIALAQDADDDASGFFIPGKKSSFHLQFLGPVILGIMVIYIGYRYWHDNLRNDKHTPDHQ